ncbi:MAG: PAS domain S-box protein, partial [Gammaproteobacteria bacterium]|nr:PAS domain S-box protein [Gammaproteobacteria bacterium]
MTALSFKLRYALAAFAMVLFAAAAVGALVLLRQQATDRQLGALAERATQASVQSELDGRARTLAAHAGDSIAGAVRAGDASAMVRRLQPFLDDSSLLGLTVTSSGGRELFRWQRPGASAAGALRAHAAVPVRIYLESIPGAATPSTLATLSLDLEQPAPLAAGRLQAHAAQTIGLTALLGLLLAAAVALFAAVLAWRAIATLHRPLGALVKSAERIGQGDYTRPVEVRTRGALTELEQALERMRGRLRQSTINKNYLHSVLNSMTDAVFVTSPDGVVRIANTAACKLLGYAEEELINRSILAVLDERDRSDFDLLRAAQETRELLVRTRAGQTIPVSFTGSRIDSDDPQFQGNIFVARNITDRKRAERRIRYLARYDALTKIPNRMQFHHVLQQSIARALRHGQVIAALYLDMDR